jgi:hypothetical protein
VRVVAPLLVVAATLGVWVATAYGQTPGGDSVVARGTTEEFAIPVSPTETSPAQWAFDVNATSGPSGENAGGQVTLDLLLVGLHLESQVTCLNVLGNEAIVGTVLDVGSTKILLEDNGPPGAEQPDTLEVGFGEFPTPNCGSSFLEGSQGVLDVIEGDIAVTDSPPSRPTSKSECRDGGYERFGFKNQGQCVAFVARDRAR